MNAKFYRFIVKGNDKKGGVLYSPKSWPYPIAVDGQEVGCPVNRSKFR